MNMKNLNYDKGVTEIRGCKCLEYNIEELYLQLNLQVR
jgi:hypothetical protein